MQTAKQNEKRDAVFEAAAEVFSQYGFRRTSMNDIAEAAGMSRPALYLLFENKEDLFRQLAADRQNKAIEAAATVLAERGALADRMPRAILAYERIYYEPVSASPHGAELMDINQSVAASDMKQGHDRLIGHMAAAIEDGVSGRALRIAGATLTATRFAELLMAAVNGQKKAAPSNEAFRRSVAEVASIFMTSIADQARNQDIERPLAGQEVS